MDILVDGVNWGTPEVTTNERDGHKAFVPDFVVVEGLPAGTHTVTLQAKNSSACNTTGERVFDYCTTNGDDTFYATVVEIPD